MVFLTNAHTKTKHEFFKGVKIWKSMDPPCIRTKFNRHPPLSIYVFNLTCPLPWKWRFRGTWMKSASWVNGKAGFRQDPTNPIRIPGGNGRIPPIQTVTVFGHKICEYWRVGIWKSKDSPLIRTEINGSSPILIHVFTSTCLLPFNV